MREALGLPCADWGRYLVRVKDLKSGHTTGQAVYIDWPGWAERVQKENPSEAAMLVFTSDKSQYNVGDDITLTIPSSEGGRGLVSIESGSKVLKTFWISTEKGQTVYKFKAEKEMSPNIYVNVSLLQKHAQTVNDLPIRMYGVIPITINDANTVLQPGKMFIVDMEQGRIIGDEELKRNICSQQPYGEWLNKYKIRLEELPEPRVTFTHLEHAETRNRG